MRVICYFLVGLILDSITSVSAIASSRFENPRDKVLSKRLSPVIYISKSSIGYVSGSRNEEDSALKKQVRSNTKSKNKARHDEIEAKSLEAARAWEEQEQASKSPSQKTVQNLKNIAAAFEKLGHYEKAFDTYLSIVNQNLTYRNIDNLRYLIHFLANVLQTKSYVPTSEKQNDILQILTFLESTPVKEFTQKHKIISDVDEMHISTIRKTTLLLSKE